MATTVGAVACTFIKGSAPTTLKARSESWTLPGVDGTGVMLLGDGDAPFSFRCVLYGTAATVATWFAALEALQGTQVTITDDWGTAHTSMFIQSVSGHRRAAELGNGGARGSLNVSGVKRA